jgi:RNA 2',3'-cyclic 3'-phosphodiesterase
VSESERIRSFVAIDVAPPVLKALQELREELARVQADVRWVRPEGLHATLKFLGAVEPPRLEEVHTTLLAAVGAQVAVRVRAHGLGAFPTLRRPRVLWVGLEGERLAELASRVDAALEPLGFEREKRGGFTPHITLGRVNSLRGWPRLEETFKAHLADDFGDSDIDGVTIYRSTLRRDGAVYTPLWTIPLERYKEGSIL